MGNTLKFNSSVCTSIKQSQRLLDLGLKPETADMVLLKELAYDEVAHCTYDADTYMIRPIDYLVGEKHRGHIPAWSLHRLLCLYGQDYTIKEVYNDAEECYGMLISAIEIAIENDEFNEKYLDR